MRYPYTRLGPSVPLRPYLKITLRNGFSTTPPLYGLVDSGADYSIFPSEFAKTYLKLDLANAIPWHFQGTTGRRQASLLSWKKLASLLRPRRVTLLLHRWWPT
jgi:hypothetical protein